MVKILIRFGKWLESRFPEKVVVTQSDYSALLLRLSAIEKTAVHVEAVTERLSRIEKQSAHVDAVRDLVKAVKLLKDEHDSFKASMGFRATGEVVNDKEAELRAVLNGEII